MKTGIYISGLGQSFVNEPVEKYARRLVNEMCLANTGIAYDMKAEEVTYAGDRTSSVITIFKAAQPDTPVYRLYGFSYHKILTERFNSYSLIRKNLWLLLLVCMKMPLVVYRLFKPYHHRRPLQTLYIFLIFLFIAGAILFTLPATVDVILEMWNEESLSGMLSETHREKLEHFSKAVLSFTAIVLLLLPNANVLVAELATEFVCASDYIEHGAQRQYLQGHLDSLVDFVSEHEPECKIHFHAYSFGSILAIDSVYPFGNMVARNAREHCEALITIGTPFEFIQSYYPNFYKDRNRELGDGLLWLNVYSVLDAFGTNFRNDRKKGEARFGIDPAGRKPVNINYELVAPKRIGFFGFFALASVKAHGTYWDPDPQGQSCMRYVLEEMRRNGLVMID